MKAPALPKATKSGGANKPKFADLKAALMLAVPQLVVLTSKHNASMCLFLRREDWTDERVAAVNLVVEAYARCEARGVLTKKVSFWFLDRENFSDL